MREAFARIQKVLQEYDLPPMSLEGNYLSETFWLSLHPSLIGEANSDAIASRHQMIPL